MEDVNNCENMAPWHTPVLNSKNFSKSGDTCLSFAACLAECRFWLSCVVRCVGPYPHPQKLHNFTGCFLSLSLSLSLSSLPPQIYPLKFQFPFYGHTITAVAVTTGGMYTLQVVPCGVNFVCFVLQRVNCYMYMYLLDISRQLASM